MSLLIESIAHIVGILFSIAIYGAWFFLLYKLFYGTLEFKSTALFIFGYIAVIAGIIEHNAEGIAGATLLLLVSGAFVSFAYDSYITLPLVLLSGYVISVLIGIVFQMN